MVASVGGFRIFGDIPEEKFPEFPDLVKSFSKVGQAKWSKGRTVLISGEFIDKLV